MSDLADLLARPGASIEAENDFDAITSEVPVSSVVSLRKASVSLPAPAEILDTLAKEADVVVSAMAD